MSSKKWKDNQKGEGDTFEFCDVCNLNHNQGRRHRYFPSHSRALSGVLSRFQKKISDIRFFVRNPTLLRPEHAALNSIWCIFCSIDICENGSSFVCANAIQHMASEEHTRNLKGFFWKHGGGIDRVDSCKISEEDLLKWGKSCETLKSANLTSSDSRIGPISLRAKDIQFQYETNSNKMDCFLNHSSSSFSSNVSEHVLPLQSLTNENYWICNATGSGSSAASHVAHGHPPLPEHTQGNMLQQRMGGVESISTNLTGAYLNHIDFKGRGALPCNAVENKRNDCRLSNGALQTAALIVFPHEGSIENVHTGGLPPWLDMSDENEKKLITFGANMDDPAPPLAQKGKIRKLNPKRVGAAWAEKRKIELQKERRGEIVAGNIDAAWLPNFGRVWQAGTRKESRKEFEKEKHKLIKLEMHSEPLIQLQPYISKRMRTGPSSKDETVIHDKNCSDMSEN